MWSEASQSMSFDDRRYVLEDEETEVASLWVVAERQKAEVWAWGSVGESIDETRPQPESRDATEHVHLSWRLSPVWPRPE